MLQVEKVVTVITLIIRTIQSFERPPPNLFQENLWIQTPTFEFIIPMSEHPYLAELERGLPNVY